MQRVHRDEQIKDIILDVGSGRRIRVTLLEKIIFGDNCIGGPLVLVDGLHGQGNLLKFTRMQGNSFFCIKQIQLQRSIIYYSISQEICTRFCFAVLCCGYAFTDFPYPSGLLHWRCGNLTIAPVPAKQPWWIWINTSCEFIMNDCITTTKQSTTKPCAHFLGYTVLCNITEVEQDA